MFRRLPTDSSPIRFTIPEVVRALGVGKNVVIRTVDRLERDKVVRRVRVPAKQGMCVLVLDRKAALRLRRSVPKIVRRSEKSAEVSDANT